MQDNKHSINVMYIFKYMTEEFKIAKLKFPPNIQPKIGMNLKDSNNNTYIISGILFENISDGIWDCKLNDSSDRLASVFELYIE